MQTITLLRGQKVFIDDEDYAAVSAHRWHLNSCGYAVRYEWRDGQRAAILLHRAIVGAARGQVADHINGNPLDNRRSNLRLVTHGESMRNRHSFRSGSSRYKGVYWNARDGKWIVRIYVDKRQSTVGRFASEEAAAHAYDEAARRLHGEFARLNFPLEGAEQCALRRTA